MTYLLLRIKVLNRNCRTNDLPHYSKELNQRENQPKCVQVYLRETPSSYVVYRPKEDQV